MQNTIRAMLSLASGVVLLSSIAVASVNPAIADEAADIVKGKQIAFNRKLGNCLTCHAMDDGEMPGNIGPPLVVMKARFPDREVLKNQIFDSRIKNPNTIMPPFGAFEILTAEELDLVVTYIHSL